MEIKNSILDAIGNTPLVRLNKVVEPGSAELLAKCEYLNPAGSIKDRMALHIIELAEQRGDLKPGGTIVENTSGNTGMGLAMAAAVKGYRCIFTMPDKMSQEKVNMLKGFGAEVIITPTDVPGDSPDHYVQTAKRIARETPGALYINQYHTQDNIDAHYRRTGPEIWRQVDGRLDAFVAGPGTGGTISGVARFLKEKNKDIRVVGADPLGSVHFQYFHTGTMGDAFVYAVEGVGDDIICGAFDTSVVDEMRQVSDKESFSMARRLVREEGLFCGGSSGTLCHVAVRVAKELGPGKRVVTLLPDSGSRYISKFLSDAWMKDHGFLDAAPELGFVADLLARKRPVVTAGEHENIGEIVTKLRQNGISQIPVTDNAGKPVSIVHEIDLLRALHEGRATPDTPARDVAQPIRGLVSPRTRIEELYHIFDSDEVAIVIDHNAAVGVISQIDLIEHLTRNGANH